MEKKSYISSAQLVLILFVTRLLFSTSYQSVLNTGNDIQDILLSVPVNFVINFIIAIPLLVLLKMHPGHDPVECTIKVAGQGVGAVIAVLYYLFFIINAAVVTGNYENFFTETVIPDVQAYVIGIFMIVVCIYGALKGIEAIARVGSVVAVLYIVTFVIIFLTVLPLINLNFLKPMLFKGTTYLMSSSVMNYNLSIQIVSVAFLSPFMRQGASLGKTYAAWNVASMIVLFLLEFNVVTSLGAFGAKEAYPLATLATLMHLSVFERLDSIDMVSWMLNTVITVTVYIYLAISCLLKLGLDKHRRIIAIVTGTVVFFAASYISHNFNILQSVMVSGGTSLAITVFTIGIPLIILIIDLIKRRVMQNVQNQ